MPIIALHSAATGLTALNTKLDIIAHNLANVNTVGFKSSRANFQDLLYQQKKLPGVENSNGDERPTGLLIGLGVKVSGTQLNFSQGSLQTTGNSLDLAIEGEGFFQIEVEDDLGQGGIAYTRAGNFVLNSEGEIVLATDQGRRLSGGFQIPEGSQVEISATGEVLVLEPGQAEPTSIGVIELAIFRNQTGLKQIGENLFVETAASGPPITGEPGQEGIGRILSGVLESSNVDPTMELIDLIKTQRAFEMNSNVIRAADETLQAVAQLRR